MTTSEFSSEFEILYNNISSNAAPGLNEYEKSVFLTQAQEELVKEVYNGTYNGDAFENTEEVRRYLDPLITRAVGTPVTNLTGVSSDSKFFSIPKEVWFRVYEQVTINSSDPCLKDKKLLVKPITLDSYFYTKRNPFKSNNSNRVLRLDLYTVDASGSTMLNNVELITGYDIKEYSIYYLAQPLPIILEDLTQYNVSINGRKSVTESQLNPVFHRDILKRAVQLAKQSWSIGN